MAGVGRDVWENVSMYCCTTFVTPFQIRKPISPRRSRVATLQAW
jgi:hypothetical protein